MSKSEDMFWAAILAANIQSADSDNRAMWNLGSRDEDEDDQ